MWKENTAIDLDKLSDFEKEVIKLISQIAFYLWSISWDTWVLSKDIKNLSYSKVDLLLEIAKKHTWIFPDRKIKDWSFWILNKSYLDWRKKKQFEEKIWNKLDELNDMTDPH